MRHNNRFEYKEVPNSVTDAFFFNIFKVVGRALAFNLSVCHGVPELLSTWLCLIK